MLLVVLMCVLLLAWCTCRTRTTPPVSPSISLSTVRARLRASIRRRHQRRVAELQQN